MSPAPNIYICIPVFNRVAYTVECIESIRKQAYTNYRIIVCDDGSTDGTSRVLAEKYPDVVLLQGNGNLWWAGATNKCIVEALSTGNDNDFVFTLNNDTELCEDTLQNAIHLALSLPRSIIGAVNVFHNDPSRIEPSAFRRRNRFPFRLYPYRIHKLGDRIPEGISHTEVDAFAGKGVLIPFSAFREAGLYNAAMLPQYHADTEFTLRARKHGYHLYYSYKARVLSHQYLTGTGTMSTSFREFVRSFGNIKSAIHYESLVNFSKLVYGRKYRIYLYWQLTRIVLGYFRRFFRKDYRSDETPAI